MNKGQIWTKKEEEILKTLIEHGCTIEQCCNVFPSRSIDSLRRKIVRMGLEIIRKEPDINFEAFKQLMRGKQECL